jgi:hypothetical protein
MRSHAACGLDWKQRREKSAAHLAVVKFRCHYSAGRRAAARGFGLFLLFVWAVCTGAFALGKDADAAADKLAVLLTPANRQKWSGREAAD